MSNIRIILKLIKDFVVFNGGYPGEVLNFEV